MALETGDRFTRYVCGSCGNSECVCSRDAEIARLRAEVEVAKEQARRRAEWFAWCQQELGPLFPGGSHHDENARTYILRLRSERDAAKKDAEKARAAHAISDRACNEACRERDAAVARAEAAEGLARVCRQDVETSAARAEAAEREAHRREAEGAEMLRKWGDDRSRLAALEAAARESLADPHHADKRERIYDLLYHRDLAAPPAEKPCATCGGKGMVLSGRKGSETLVPCLKCRKEAGRG